MKTLIPILLGIFLSTTAHAQTSRQIQGSDIQNLGVTATGTTQPRSLADRFAQAIYNVRDCGAKGDNTTDDGPALLACVNLACTSKYNQVQATVYFPPGTYRTTQQLTPWCALNLIGESRDSSYINFDDPTGTHDFFYPGVRAGGITVKGLNFNRVQAATAGAMIHLTDVYFVTIRDSTFNGANLWDGVLLDCQSQVANKIYIESNQFFSLSNDGVHINCTAGTGQYGVYDTHIFDNYFSDLLGAAVEIHGYAQGILVDHNFLAHNKYGILGDTAGLSNLVQCCSKIRSNDIDSSTTAGIYWTGANETQFDDNWIDGFTCILCANISDIGSHYPGTHGLVLNGAHAWLSSGMMWTNNATPVTIGPSGGTQSTLVTIYGSSQWFNSASCSGTPTFIVINIANVGVGNCPAASLSASGSIGYATGFGTGGAVTQGTSRTTGVTLNNITGAITMFTGAPVIGTPVSFTVTNSAVAATDVVYATVKSATNTYEVITSATGSGSFQLTVTSLAGTASDTPVINFAIIKGSSN
jgi:hypothetical protein